MPASNQTFDLLIRCGHLLTMDKPLNAEGSVVLERDQMIGVTGSKIAYVGPWADGTQAKKTIDARGQIVMPGLINGHCHLPMTMFRGLADDQPFDAWLNKYMLPLEARLVSPEFVTLGSELALLECLLSGTTTVYDMYYYEESIAEACEASGIRSLLGETVFDFTAPDNKGRDGGDFRILDKMVERYKGHERITPFIAPHAPYSCSDDTIKKATAYALKKGIQVGIHVSETLGEVETSVKEHGKTPLRRIADLGMLEAPTMIAHGVHLTDEEIEICARKKASVIYNPESNMKLGAGAAPVPKLLKAGVTVGMGTDGPGSNNDLNMFIEMNTGAKLQKMVHHDNTAMTAAMALKMTTVDGAKAMGLANTGRLAVGMLADIIVVDPRTPNMQPLHDIGSQLVYASTGKEVSHVVVHGKVVVENRRCLTIDQDEVFEKIADYRKRSGF